MSKHTPTPWRVEPGHSVVNLVGPDGERIGAVARVPYWQDYSELDAADAAFIVRAVNSHDALVSALQIIASRADGYTHGDKRVEMAFSGIAELALVALAAEKEEAA